MYSIFYNNLIKHHPRNIGDDIRNMPDRIAVFIYAYNMCPCLFVYGFVSGRLGVGMVVLAGT